MLGLIARAEGGVCRTVGTKASTQWLSPAWTGLRPPSGRLSLRGELGHNVPDPTSRT